MGGLGNQMFQYSAGQQLAHLHRTELLVDTSYLETDPEEAYTKRNLELEVFNLKLEIATQEDIARFKIKSAGKISRALQRHLPILCNTVYAAESGLHFQKQFFNFPLNTYLDGFWQSEEYFKGIRANLLAEFVPKEATGPENLAWIHKMISCESVSLHIRRGDYITSLSAQQHHGNLDISYYQRAVRVVKDYCSKEIEIFVFSDDLEWCKENLTFDEQMHFVDSNQVKNFYWDMFLMSRCRHNIIANSSFSWWAAWLNQNEKKCVVAPIHWFADQSVRNNNLIPSTWHLT
jgi:hypothetical protein